VPAADPTLVCFGPVASHSGPASAVLEDSSSS
jgi:hypothetical protein